jgi:hypothetical protein
MTIDVYFVDKLRESGASVYDVSFRQSYLGGVKEHYRLQLCRKNLVNFKQWFSEFTLREFDVSAIVFMVICWHV